MKRVYTFGNGKAEGRADMKNLLGGKGANLAEMNLIGVPVPPGFTITTEVCTTYTQQGKEAVVKEIKGDVEKAIAHIESLTGTKFGDASNPLLVSVRSGARVSMPGMMDTVLNLGMNDDAVEAIAKKSGNARFAWDSYRRFVQMYGDVVLGMKPKTKEDIDPFEEVMDKVKEAKGIKSDTELQVEDLKELVKLFKAAVKENTGKDFPASPWEQLWGAICAVFDSWMNERAILYRRMNQIPEEWGTAVNVQAMVFGNMGNTSATGVAFTRDAATGEDIFNGEYLINAQVDKTIEVSQCEANNKLTVEGQTLISTSYGNLVFPENDYTNYTGINFEATNFEKLDENATNAICSLKIEYTQDGETVKVSMGFYTQGKKKVQFSAFKDEKAGKIAIDPSSITKVSIGMGKNKKVDINNIVLVAKK